LATRYDTTVAVIRKHVAVDQIEEWGKVHRIDGGDTMNASALVSSAEDRRDATFVRVCVPYVYYPPVLTSTQYSIKHWWTQIVEFDAVLLILNL
jgi:hypothetical protein